MITTVTFLHVTEDISAVENYDGVVMPVVEFLTTVHPGYQDFMKTTTVLVDKIDEKL